jgi:hypothetical protein
VSLGSRPTQAAETFRNVERRVRQGRIDDMIIGGHDTRGRTKLNMARQISLWPRSCGCSRTLSIVVCFRIRCDRRCSYKNDQEWRYIVAVVEKYELCSIGGYKPAKDTAAKKCELLLRMGLTA